MAELNLFQYLPQNTILHNADGRVKLMSMILLTVATGLAQRIPDLILLTLVLCWAFRIARLPVKNLLRQMKYFLFLIGIIIVTTASSIPGTPILAGIPAYSPSWEGLASGFMYGWRIILILIISSLLTGTTTLTSLKNGIEWFLTPLPFVPAARVAMMFSLTFVLLPMVFDQASEMLEAQKSRSIESRKNPLIRVRYLVFPLLLQVFNRADEMVLAMESRSYSEVRTKAAFKTNRMDWLILAFTAVVFGIVVIRYLFA